MNACMSTSPQSNWQTHWSPRALTVVSTRKLEKLALNSGMSKTPRLFVQEPSMAKNSSPSRAQKLALKSGTTRGARKKASIPPKMPRPRPPPFHRRHNRQEPRPVSVASWNVHHICDELNLWHFHPHGHRDVHNLVELHHGHWSLHPTGVSTTLSRARRLQCGSSAVFSTPALGNWTGTTGTSITVKTMGICLCTTTEMSTNTTSLHDHSDVHKRR